MTSTVVATATDRRAARAAEGRLRRRSPRRRGRGGLIGLLFALPFILVFIAFGVGPLLASAAMSFTDMTVSDIRNPLGVDVVGFDQFAQLFHDRLFWQSLGVTMTFVLLSVPLTLAAGLALAVVLDRGIRRFRALFRVGFYTPVITSIVAVAVVWRYLLQPDGIVNSALETIGIVGPNWLNDTRTALPALVAMSVWRGMGNMMIIFLAGLQAVPRETLEAASVDGAGPWRSFWSVTLPQLRPTMLLATVILTIGFLQIFEEPFVMTGGGPLASTTSLSLFVYNQFGYGKYAYGTAAAYVLFVIIAALAVLQFRVLRSKEN